MNAWEGALAPNARHQFLLLPTFECLISDPARHPVDDDHHPLRCPSRMRAIMADQALVRTAMALRPVTTTPSFASHDSTSDTDSRVAAIMSARSCGRGRTESLKIPGLTTR